MKVSTQFARRVEAYQKGETTYQGGICKFCKGTERYTVSGSCVSCRRQKQREYHQERRELIQEARQAREAKSK